MITALIDHLWQSSLFAACAWLVAMQCRKQGAHLRYWIWFTASIKFLLPFSLLVSAGEWLGHYVLPVNGQAALSQAVHHAVAPIIPTIIAPSFYWSRTILLLCLLIWAIGFLGLATRWLIRWSSIRRVIRSAEPTAMVSSVPVMISPMLHEPGVVGIFKPVLLLPEGITDRLTPSQLHAILDHELCHVRRRDNLTSAIHMLVESVFWFHPLVWWIGARLIDERERACDESVVQSGNEPQTYAEGILKVCQHYLASKLTCMAGVSSANLKTRVEIIMKSNVATPLGNSKKVMLGTLAFTVLVVPVVVGLTAEQSIARSTDSKAPATITSLKKTEPSDDKGVTLNFEDIEVRTVLRLLAETMKVNMLVSDKVTGTVTLHFEDMPPEKALDIILASKGLTRHEKDGTVFVDVADKNGT